MTPGTSFGVAAFDLLEGWTLHGGFMTLEEAQAEAANHLEAEVIECRWAGSLLVAWRPVPWIDPHKHDTAEEGD